MKSNNKKNRVRTILDLVTLRSYTLASLLVFAISLNAGNAFAQTRQVEERIDFDQHILPLLSDRCFKCHGPDESTRESGLRFDTQEGAFAVADSGELAIVAGDASKSLLIQRIMTEDVDLQMPPPESGLHLSESERETLRDWIYSPKTEST
jgi:hypothetical protein